MRTRKFPALIALLVAFAAVTAGAAGAQTVTADSNTADVEAVVTQTELAGNRYIASVAGSTDDLVTDPSGETQLTAGFVELLQVDSSTVLEGAVPVSVVENNASGANPWSVAMSVTDFQNGSADVISKADAEVNDRSVTNAYPLTGIGVSGGNVSVTTSATAEDLSVERTLYTVSGQDTTALYTGTWASTSDLALNLPNGAKTGTYTATLTVTLYE